MHKMADESLYDLAGRKEERKEMVDEEEWYKQMKVVSLDDRKRVKCESCVRGRCGWFDESSSSGHEIRERARQLYERVAVFLCFVCEMYVCAECLPKHRDCDGMKVGRKENEGNGEQREREKNEGLGKCKIMGVEAESEREREREKKERDIERIRERLFAKKLWDDVMNESETESEKKFKTNQVRVIDRVCVQHALDLTEHCYISGLCGLENKRLVVCDIQGSCIKIFKLGSHVLQRYIRFVRSQPWYVTEIVLKQNSTEPNLMSGSSSGISATDRDDPNNQCLIAVTLPGKRQIMFIDLSKKPAKPQKIIHTEGRCWSIQFFDDKIFTICREDPDSRCSVYIYSTDGDTLNMFYIGIFSVSDFSVPRLAVVSGRVYITDEKNNTVQRRNVEGQFTSRIDINGSRPAGISVDPDNNVYICASGDDEVYKLDADLTRCRSVLDQNTGYIVETVALCYYRDKLFIGHDLPTSLCDFVTVVRLL